MEGMRRFVDRVWNLCNKVDHQVRTLGVQESVQMHKTIKRVTDEIENMRFNTAIAAIMEYVNALKNGASEKNLKVLVQLLAPFAPHMAEEVWVNVLGQKYSVHTSSWPKYDPKLVIEDKVEIPIQVNGKLRATVTVQRTKCKEQGYVVGLAKSNQKVKKYIKGKKIKKTIFVSGKLINFVV